MTNIPIVIVAFDRKECLSRLLNSIERAFYPDKTKLIISIDGGGSADVVALANSFHWKYGEKEVILQSENLGLRKHILSCGSLVEYYSGIILLEDDLFVSPYYYDYALSAYGCYKEDKDICGIALYSHTYNETACLPFLPIIDSSDVYFMQTACSWGQLWSKEQWRKFIEWYSLNEETEMDGKNQLPGNVSLWPSSSWKKFFIKYMLENDKYFVYPRNSYTTNFGDAGQHHYGTNLWQVPLQYEKVKYNFKAFEDSYAKYDAFCEILPSCIKRLAPHLATYEITVDLFGMKMIDMLESEYVITSQECLDYDKSYGRNLKPHEANIMECIEGKNIFLAKRNRVKGYDDFLRYRAKVISDIEKSHYYFYQVTKNHFHSFDYKIAILNNAIHRFEGEKNELHGNGQANPYLTDKRNVCFCKVRSFVITLLKSIKKIVTENNRKR